MERSDLDHWRGREVARLLALVETQRRYYQEIVASIPVGLLVLSSELSILMANGAARKIFSLQTGEYPRRIDSILPASLLDRIEEVLRTSVQQTGVIVEIGRDRRRLRVGILAIHNWDQEAAHEALLTIEDLTGVEVIEAVAAKGARCDVEPPVFLSPVMEAVPAISAQKFVDNVDAIVWAVDLSSMNFVFASPQAEKLLGFAPEHWTSHPSFWLDRVHDSDRDWVSQSYQRAIETGIPHSCEFQAITASGSTVRLREYSRFLSTAEDGGDDQPRYMIGVAVDVTERRMLEDQLVQSERVEAVSRLAGRMAHDLNNTLMILTGYSEELLTGLPAGSSARGDIQEILAATDRMSGLTSQLLSFARRQGGAVKEIDLESTLGRFGPRLNSLLGTHVGLEFRMSGEPIRVLADIAQLERAMTAIVERARQAMHAGEKIVVETSRIDVTEDLRHANASLQPGNYALISVVAPGQRLDAEAKAALFECSMPGKEPWDDVAAALSRAYRIVRQWGGDISVFNGPRSALIFRVFLPRIDSPAGEPAESAFVPEPPPAPPEPPAPIATILVVEDEAGIRALVRKILRRQGYEVLEAADGQDALTLCREHGKRVELLITDVLMPHMGGRELVERLQTQGHDMKVLYVSGYTDDTTVYSAELPPGTAFLQKPFTLGSLLDKVREVLAK